MMALVLNYLCIYARIGKCHRKYSIGVFCLCRLRAFKMVSCLDNHVIYLGEHTEKQTETEKCLYRHFRSVN